MKTNKSGIRIVALALLGGLGCGDLQTGDGEAVSKVTVRLSVAAAGDQSNGNSSRPAISSDGRYVVFSSDASNLAPGDINNGPSIYLRDRATDAVELISVNDQGLPVGKVFNDGTIFESSGTNQAVSTDGRYVAFENTANLDVSLDATNGDQPVTAGTVTRVFVRDRTARTTRMASFSFNRWSAAVAADSCTLGGMSRDGRWVVFNTKYLYYNFGSTDPNYPVYTNNDGVTARYQVYLADMSVTPAKVYLISHVNGNNLTGGNQDSGRDTSTVPLTSICAADVTVADGRVHVAYSSFANNLQDGLAAENQIHLWKSGTNLASPMTGSTNERISKTVNNSNMTNQCNNPTISADGRYVAFQATPAYVFEIPPVAGEKQNIFRRDVTVPASSSSIIKVVDTSAAALDKDCTRPRISDDGRYVAFFSESVALGAEEPFTEAYLRDLQGGIERASLSTQGTKGIGSASYPAASGNGRFLVYGSSAGNLVVNDTNGYTDIFVRGPSK